MNALKSVRYDRFPPAQRRYTLRRCAWCRKFLGIVFTDSERTAVPTICYDCYRASLRTRTRS